MIRSYDDAVFICKNHMMTAFMPGGYGEIEFAPNELADWSNGTTVISWHQSTFRTSPRDWTDLLITPFNENLVLHNNFVVDLKGRPRDALQVEMCSCEPTKFLGHVISSFQSTDIASADLELERVLTPSAVTRTLFRLELSRTHVRFGAPDIGLWWIDRDIPPLSFTRGVVQLGHHSYTPDKECTPKPGVLSCTGNTWHWSDFSISSAVPFTMLRGLTGAGQHISPDTSPVVQFSTPAPANSHLRFAAVGKISVSFDGGKTWVAAQVQPSETNPNGTWADDMFYSYWVPVPEGTTKVVFGGRSTYWAPWWIVDPAIWSETQLPSPPATEAPVAALPSAATTVPTPAAHAAVGSMSRSPVWLSSARSLLGSRYLLVGGLVGVFLMALCVGALVWGRRRRATQRPPSQS